LILEAKRTLSIDISELELPYIPKQVLDCIFIDHLIADKNLLDEVDPAIGRMGNLSVLRSVSAGSRVDLMGVSSCRISMKGKVAMQDADVVCCLLPTPACHGIG